MKNKEDELEDELCVKRKRPKFTSCIYSSCLFSASMMVGAVLYSFAVIFFIPTEALEASQWQVFTSFKYLFYIICLSVMMMPLIFLFQYVGKVDFSKKKFFVECIALCFSLIFSVLFFWPAYGI